MPAKRAKQISGPPADGSATVEGGIRFTIEDVEMFARQAGLPTEGATIKTAGDLAELIDVYILRARIQRTNSNRATAPEWGAEFARWATRGRELLEDDQPHIVHLNRAITHLCNATPITDKQLRAVFDQSFFAVTGSHFGNAIEPAWTKASVIALLLEKTAYALRVIQILGERVQSPSATKGKQIDYAHLYLVKGIGNVFVQLFPDTPFNVVTRKKKQHGVNERGAYPDGPAVLWCRAVLTTAAERVVRHPADPLLEMSDLSKWAAKPDALPKIIRKLNAKPTPKPT